VKIGVNSSAGFERYATKRVLCMPIIETLKEITPQIKLVDREHELSRVRREMSRNKLETEMIGVSRAMQKVFDLILRCAEVDYTILIFGETGVGKKVAARAIHSQSNRKNKPLVRSSAALYPRRS
jgi:DNA-binding NtrC family response regulator